MSRAIELRRVTREAWRSYLDECHDADVDDHEKLLEIFMTSPDLIRAAVAQLAHRRASARGKVVEIPKEAR